MTDDLVKQAIAELQDVVRCRCHPAYTGRGLHDPECECDSADAVKVVSDRIEELEAERDEALNQLDSTRHSVEVLEANVARMRDALYKALEVLEASAFTNAEHAQAELQAAVAAEREACAEIANAAKTRNTVYEKARRDAAAAIRARTDTDAQAALEAVKREARNEALREALAKIESHIEVVPSGSPTRFALDWVRDDILTLMEDTDDE